MDDIRKKFVRLANAVLDADWQQIEDRLKDLFDFLDHQPALRLATQRLMAVPKEEVDRAISLSASRRAAPSIAGEEKQLRLSLELARIGAATSVNGMCVQYSIWPPHRSKHCQDFVDTFKNNYLRPLFQYLGDELDRAADGVSVADIAQQTRFDIEATVASSFPALAEELSQTEHELAAASDLAGYNPGGHPNPAIRGHLKTGHRRSGSGS